MTKRTETISRFAAHSDRFGREQIPAEYVLFLKPCSKNIAYLLYFN